MNRMIFYIKNNRAFFHRFENQFVETIVSAKPRKLLYDQY